MKSHKCKLLEVPTQCRRGSMTLQQQRMTPRVIASRTMIIMFQSIRPSDIDSRPKIPLAGARLCTSGSRRQRHAGCGVWHRVPGVLLGRRLKAEGPGVEGVGGLRGKLVEGSGPQRGQRRSLGALRGWRRGNGEAQGSGVCDHKPEKSNSCL